jgi:hypothetical protein
MSTQISTLKSESFSSGPNNPQQSNSMGPQRGGPTLPPRQMGPQGQPGPQSGQMGPQRGPPLPPRQMGQQSGQMGSSSGQAQVRAQQPQQPQQQQPQQQQPQSTQSDAHEKIVDDIIKEIASSENEKTNESFNNQAETKKTVASPTLTKEASTKSLLDNILNAIKLPIAVGIIVLFLSIPTITNLFSKVLPNKEVITNNINIIVPLLKGIIGALLYFAASRLV